MLRLVDLIFLKISAARAKMFAIIYASILEIGFILHFICSMTFQSDIYARAYNGGTLIFGAIVEFLILSLLLFGSVFALLKDNKRLFIASITLLSVLFFVGRFIAVANDPYSISGVGWAVAYWIFKFFFYTILFAYFILTGIAFVFDRPLFRVGRLILLIGLVMGFVYYIMAIVAGASTIKNNGFSIWDMFIEPLLMVGGALFFPTALFAMELDSSFEYGDEEYEEPEVIEEAVVIVDEDEEAEEEPEPEPVKKPAAKKPAAKAAPAKKEAPKKEPVKKAPANRVPSKKPAAKK